MFVEVWTLSNSQRDRLASWSAGLYSKRVVPMVVGSR
jgi:hypothetical protein